ncbi:MAG TPA: OsmC family protein [Piscirickettsiaceae bacterium]|nr:OsmC family protein [Piscirickettsiaceae bacterium]HIQ39563.1 OsmC family protein [Sulfurivirga caldicuralii]
MDKVATVKWVDHLTMLAETASGHGLVMDGPPDVGGQNLGPRPMELVLAGLGGCTTVDVIVILQKAGQDVRGCRVEVSAERADTVPKVYTKIHVHYIVSGKNLDAKKVERAVKLSAEKYCSVSRMLEQAAAMTHDFTIEEVD